MEKLIIALTCVFIYTGLFSQEQTESRVFDGPSELWIDGDMTVNLHYAKEPKIDISAYKVDLEFIYTRIKNEELLIRVDPIDIEDGSVTIEAYMPKLKAITITRPAVVHPEKQVFDDSVTIKMKAGAEMITELENKRLDIDISTGAFLELKGKLENLDGVIKRGGKLRTDNLDLENAKLRVRSGSFAAVKANESIDAHACFGGELKLLNIPKRKILKTHFGGTIEIEATND